MEQAGFHGGAHQTGRRCEGHHGPRRQPQQIDGLDLFIAARKGVCHQAEEAGERSSSGAAMGAA